MESSAPLWFSIIIYALEVSVVAKILYLSFFTDRIKQGQISEKQSPELAGKRFLVYSQIILVPKAYICEYTDLAEYFRLFQQQNLNNWQITKQEESFLEFYGYLV